MIALNVCKPIHGYLFATKYPSLLVSLSIEDYDHKKTLVVANTLLKELGSSKLLETENKKNNIVYYIFSQCIEEIISISGWPVFQKNILISANQKGRYQLLIPCIKNGFPALIKTIKLLIELLNSAIKKELEQQDYQSLLKTMNHLKSFAPSDTNSRNFIKTALHLKIPFTQIVGDVYQFGYCEDLRWLQSTFTDKTSVISSVLARNKFNSIQLLRECGLPVPKNIPVNDLQSAINAANNLTYPVVVKPMDLDGGLGVFANIENEAELTSAYKKTRGSSKNILVEKHHIGKDYRLVVYDNQLIFAIERVPASVLGDGVNSIAQLLELSNKFREDKPSLKKLSVNEEAKAILDKMNYTENSIPKNGEMIPLSFVANIGRGGFPRLVLDEVHPDNKALVIKATEYIGLDIAGIDLLIPDIRLSWKVAGNEAVIIEVNAQPTLGTLTSSHLYGFLLENLTKRKGHIPIVVVLGDFTQKNTAEVISDKLLSNNVNAALLSDGIIKKPEDLTIYNINPDIYRCGLIISKNKNVQAVIMDIKTNDLLRDGIAFSYIDTLLIAGESVMNENSAHSKQEFNNVIAAILPMVETKVICSDSNLDEKLRLIIERHTQRRKIEFKNLSTHQAIDEIVSLATNDYAETLHSNLF